MLLYSLILSVLLNQAFGAVVWECTNWDSSDPWGRCGWGQSSISWGADNIRFQNDPAGSGANTLSIFYPRNSCVSGCGSGSMRGGTQFYGRPFGGQSFDEATLEYDIYFSPNFDFVKGGKLPGFWGGTGSCSGGGSSESCFSLRYMWRREGDGEIYGYIPNEKDDWFCSNPDVTCNFEFGHSFGRGSFRFTTGRWQKIAEHIRLNTPGQKNGSMRILVDGRQVYEISGIMFRASNQASLKIDSIYFSTFFGGGDTSWATPNDVYTYYRNFRVTTP